MSPVFTKSSGVEDHLPFAALYGYLGAPADGTTFASYIRYSFPHADVMAAALVDDDVWQAPAPVLCSKPLLFFYCSGAAIAVAKASKAGLVVDVAGDAESLHRLSDVVAGKLSVMQVTRDAATSARSAIAELRHAAYTVLVAAASRVPPPPPAPLSPASPSHWALLMGLEHEALSTETLERLVRRLPIRSIDASRVAHVWRLAPSHVHDASAAPQNALVSVPGADVLWLGAREEPPEGVDDPVEAERLQLRVDARRTCRQSGARGPIHVATFRVAAFKVSNAEYLPFVADLGYEQPAFWAPQAWADGAAAAGAPMFWVRQDGGGWRLRTTLSEIDMPWDWPVEVTFAEANAWLAWRQLKEQQNRDERAPTTSCRNVYRLPTEAEHVLLAGPAPTASPAVEQAVHHGDERGGQSPVASLEWRWHSPSAVNALQPAPTGVHDPAGTVWEWVIDDCGGAPAHGRGAAALVGGCWASSGDPATSARYNAAAGRGALVAASFRYVVDGEAASGGMLDAGATAVGAAADAEAVP